MEQAKSSAATIEASLKESVSLQESLENERKAYLPLSQAAANLYFVISDLSKLNNMYRFSLNAFQSLFHKALQAPQVIFLFPNTVASFLGYVTIFLFIMV